MNRGESNLAWADALLAAFVVAGVKEVVLAPGARSAPLALAALRRPEVRCHVINDERAAGFFALGLGKAQQKPALALTTSGTAAANLLPAIVEANLAAVPLIVLTADRPPESLGWGANQAIDQIKLYGDQVRACHALPVADGTLDARFCRALAARLVTAACSPRPGPVHVNVPFREPLLPTAFPPPPALPEPIVQHRPPADPPPGLESIAARLSGRPGVIVCGAGDFSAGFADAIARLAAALEAPVIAEALSGLRCGPHDKSHILAHAARFLRTHRVPQPAWVLRCGAFPVSRVLERWLASLPEADHLLVAPCGEWPDPLWLGTTRIEGDPLALARALAPLCRPASADFCAAWRAAEQACKPPEAFFEGHVARMLIERLPADARLFVGNSLAIRAVDAFGGISETPLRLYGNRGASGIDGNLATAAGIATATAAPTVALAGDQTLLHDATSLALFAGRDALIVLLDNRGGRIFEHLPFAAVLPARLLERGFLAPARIDHAALAAAFGLGYRRATDAESFSAALQTCLAGGAWLLHASIDPEVSRACFAS